MRLMQFVAWFRGHRIPERPIEPRYPLSFRPALGWLTVAVVLVLVLVAEMMRARPAAPPDPVPAEQPKRTATHNISPSEDTADSVRTILARPLFAASRRPVASPSSHVTALPRLTGVIIAPGTRLALFLPSDGKTLAAADGSAVLGYEIRSIRPDEVVLTGPDGEHVLHTGFTRVTPHVIHAQQEAAAQ